MATQLPDLATSGCTFFVACGQVVADDKATLAKLKRLPNWMVARTRVGRKTVYVRAGFGGKRGKHCHFDIARADIFPPEQHPKQTHKFTAVQKAIGQLHGNTVDVELDGWFHVPSTDLPMIITLARLGDIKVGDVEVKLAGGRLSVKGAPVYAIDWRANEDADEALIHLEARVKETVDDDYLIRLYAMLTSALQSFVTSGVPNATS